MKRIMRATTIRLILNTVCVCVCVCVCVMIMEEIMISGFFLLINDKGTILFFRIVCLQLIEIYCHTRQWSSSNYCCLFRSMLTDN